MRGRLMEHFSFSVIVRVNGYLSLYALVTKKRAQWLHSFNITTIYLYEMEINYDCTCTSTEQKNM